MPYVAYKNQHNQLHSSAQHDYDGTRCMQLTPCFLSGSWARRWIYFRCSGRTRCVVYVADPALQKLEPCSKDFTSYLEAKYTCLSGNISFHFRGALLCRWPELTIANVSVRPSVRPSVCLSVMRWHSIKTTQAKITNSSLSAPWRTSLSASVKLFQKFESGHPDRWR